MNPIFLNVSVLGSRKSGVVRKPVSIETGVKSFTEDFAWQDDGVECLSQSSSRLIAPTGSGKQPIISAAAYVHAYKQGQRATIVVPSLGLGNSYLKETIRRRSGELYEVCIPKYLDFRGTADGYHDSTTEAYVEYLLHNQKHGSIAVTTSSTLVGAWKTLLNLSDAERKRAFTNLWMAFDEAHHISGVLAYDEDVSDEYRKTLIDFRTYLGDICEYVCDLPTSANYGMSAVTATWGRGDRVQMFYDKVDKLLSKNEYVRPFIDHWKYLEFEAFHQRCVGYDDDPIETLLQMLSPEDCSIVYLCPAGNRYRSGDNPQAQDRQPFVKDAIERISARGLRVLDLITKNTQEENMCKLQDDNKHYKGDKLAARGYDVVLAVNLLREGTDYVAVNHVHDLAPSPLQGRIVQTIGRMMRKDDRKDSPSYTSYFRNLHLHADDEETRKHVSDRVNYAYSGVLGILNMFDDSTRILMPVEPRTSPIESQVLSVFNLNPAMDEIFGGRRVAAEESFQCKLSDGETPENAAIAVIKELRGMGWSGDTLAAKAALEKSAELVDIATPRYDDDISPPLIPPQMEFVASEIREVHGFDETKVVPTSLFAASINGEKIAKLDGIVRTMMSNAAKQDRLAYDYRFGADITPKAKKAYQKKRRKHKATGRGSAIAPTIGEP